MTDPEVTAAEAGVATGPVAAAMDLPRIEAAVREILLAVGERSPYRDLASLIAAARKDPERLTYGTGGAGIEVDYQFVRLICSKFDGNDPSHAMVRAIMEQSFGPALLPVPILESAEISHAAMRMMTVYELEKPIGTPKTHKRSRANLDEALRQVEQLVRQGWGRVEPASEEAVIHASA